MTEVQPELSVAAVGTRTPIIVPYFLQAEAISIKFKG